MKIYCMAFFDPHNGVYTDRNGRLNSVQTWEWEKLPLGSRATLPGPWDSVDDFAKSVGLTKIGKGVPIELALWRVKAIAEMMPNETQGNCLAAIDAAVANMPGKEGIVARHAWNGNVIVRYDRFVTSMGALLGFGDAELDAVFVAAGKL